MFFPESVKAPEPTFVGVPVSAIIAPLKVELVFSAPSLMVTVPAVLLIMPAAVPAREPKLIVPLKLPNFVRVESGLLSTHAALALPAVALPN